MDKEYNEDGVCVNCEEEICVCDQILESMEDDGYPVTQQAEGTSELVHLNQICRELHIQL